jgi:four helix bundle protein
MQFDYEKLDVYKVSIQFVTYVFSVVDKLKGKYRFTRDQLIRASQSIPLNIAEGSGKRSKNDKKRFFEIARGSSMECGAILDIIVSCKIFTSKDIEHGRNLLYRIVSMLSKMTER